MLIAERTLEVFNGSDTHPVVVKIQSPKILDSKDWACEYEIGWPEGPRRFAGHGIDSVQALVIALQMIGTELYTSNYPRSGQLRYEGVPGGYGFPIAANCRELLSGYDREFL